MCVCVCACTHALIWADMTFGLFIMCAFLFFKDKRDNLKRDRQTMVLAVSVTEIRVCSFKKKKKKKAFTFVTFLEISGNFSV